MRRLAATIALAAPLVACGAFLGLDDGTEDPSNVFPSTPGADAGDASGEGGALSTTLEAGRDVATGNQRPGPLLVDATHLYWLALPSAGVQGALMRVPKEGGTPETLTGNLDGPQALVADATSIFFSENRTSSGNYQLLEPRASTGRTAPTAGSAPRGASPERAPRDRAPSFARPARFA